MEGLVAGVSRECSMFGSSLGRFECRFACSVLRHRHQSDLTVERRLWTKLIVFMKLFSQFYNVGVRDFSLLLPIRV